MKRTVSLLVGSVLFLSLLGCGPPQRLTEGITYFAAKDQAADAASLRVGGHGELRFTVALRSDLDDALAEVDLDALREEGLDVLRRAHRLALETLDGEIDRMSPRGLAELVRTYRLDHAPADPARRRAFLKRAAAERARAAFERDEATLRSAATLAEARCFLRDIRARIEPPPGDRGKLGRILVAAPLFLPAAIGAEIADREATQRALVADFDQVIEYRPAEMPEVPSADGLAQASPQQLARWFAPVFAQQFDAEARYPQADDRIGRVYLTGRPGDIRVHIDVDDPVVYWTHGEARVGQRRYDQLIYVAWYPERPALTPNDPQAGHIDGIVVRITLDRHERPAIYEFVRSCGCFHTLWVAEFVEAEAREQFGPPIKGMRFAVQRDQPGRGLFIPELVPDDGSRPGRPVAFVSAGSHMVMIVRPLAGADVPPAVEKHTYRLEPYDNLTRLPLGDGVASMFGSDGLVHNAGRGEGWLLAPTGMLSAGQPRQLGTMKIRLDAYDYDDPRLLEGHLRLPGSF